MWRAVTRRVEIQTTNISKSFSQNGGQLETTSVRKRTVRIIINTGMVSKNSRSITNVTTQSISRTQVAKHTKHDHTFSSLNTLSHVCIFVPVV